MRIRITVATTNGGTKELVFCGDCGCRLDEYGTHVPWPSKAVHPYARTI